MNIKALLLLMSLAALSCQGAIPVFYDAFDSGYANGQTFLVATNGWQASSYTAYVTNSGGYSGSAAYLGSPVILTNTLNADPALKVWGDLRIKPALGVPMLNPQTNQSSFYCYFDSNGVIMVASPTGWRACTNDVWGNAVPAVSNDYVRLSVFMDYGTSTQAVFLNDQLLVQDLPFVGVAAGCSNLVIKNSDRSCWLDNVWVKTNVSGLASNRNGDAMTDADEIQQYGYARRTLYVSSSATNLVPCFPSITNAVASWRPRDIIHVIAGTYGAENVTLSANPSNVVFEGDAFTVNTLTIAAGAVASFAQSVNMGTLSLTGQMAGATSLTAATAHAVGSLTVQAGGVFVVTNLDVATSGSVNAATVAQSITLSGTAAFGGQILAASNLVVVTGANVTFAQSVNCGILAITGQVAMASGASLTSGTATVQGSLTVSTNGTLLVTNLTVAGSGSVQFTTNASFVAVNPPLVMNGPFTLSSTWGTTATMPLPFSDNFDTYANNTPVTNLGFRGWYASGGTGNVVKVQDTVSNSKSNSVVLPGGTVLSNSISASSVTNVWSDFHIRPTLGAAPWLPATNTSSFLSYADSNGYLVVAAAGTGWHVCSNKIDGVAPTLLSSNAFTRITVCQNLSSHTFAVFVDGDLVAKGLSAPTPLNGISSLVAYNRDRTAYLDDVSITTEPPALSSDLDHDGMADALEIQYYGDTAAASLRGLVLRDVNGNGTQDAADTNELAGVQVILTTNGVALLTNVTGVSGGYSFTNLLPGAYNIVETDPEAYFSTTPNTVPVTVVSGQSWLTNNFLDRLAIPAFTLTKSVTAPLGRAPLCGEPITFSISVANVGEGALVGVPVTDTFDANTLAYVSAAPSPDTAGGNTLTWVNVGPIAAGGSTNLSVTFQTVGITMPGSGTNVVISAPQTQLNYPPVAPATNSATYRIEITGTVYKLR